MPLMNPLLFLILLAFAADATAANLRAGDVACRSVETFQAWERARVDGDQQKMDVLAGACLHFARDLEATDVEESGDGLVRFKVVVGTRSLQLVTAARTLLASRQGAARASVIP
ncbi:MAG: hypothetical protein AAGE01_25260 [Pseudomonadota bacterium]